MLLLFIWETPQRVQQHMQTLSILINYHISQVCVYKGHVRYLLFCMPSLMQAAKMSSSSLSEATCNSSPSGTPPVSSRTPFSAVWWCTLVSTCSSIVRLLRLVAVENWTGVLSSSNPFTLSSNTLELCGYCLCFGGKCGAFRSLGLGGTVWVGESGSSLGDTTPLVRRLKPESLV